MRATHSFAIYYHKLTNIMFGNTAPSLIKTFFLTVSSYLDSCMTLDDGENNMFTPEDKHVKHP